MCLVVKLRHRTMKIIIFISGELYILIVFLFYFLDCEALPSGIIQNDRFGIGYSIKFRWNFKENWLLKRLFPKTQSKKYYSLCSVLPFKVRFPKERQTIKTKDNSKKKVKFTPHKIVESWLNITNQIDNQIWIRTIR